MARNNKKETFQYKETNFDKIQKDVAEKLRDSGVFPEGLVIADYDHRVLEGKVDFALDKLGLAIFVIEPEEQEAEQFGGEAYIFFPKVRLAVKIVENVFFNERPFTAMQASRMVYQVLQGYVCKWTRLPGAHPQGLELARNVGVSRGSGNVFEREVHFTFPADYYEVFEGIEFPEPPKPDTEATEAAEETQGNE